MSFAQDVKKEILLHDMPRNCCAVAAAYGVACFSKFFDARGIVLHTEQHSVAQYAKKLYEHIGVHGDIVVKGTEQNPIYEYAVKAPAEVKRMLKLFGHTGTELQLRINNKVFQCANCVHNFICAAFLAGGTITDPEKAYNLEFLNSRHMLLKDFDDLLIGHNFTPRRTVRKGTNVLYFRASEQIEDMLTYMGAFQASLTLMNAKVYKEVRNNTNRIANCDTANIDKTIAANARILDAIALLKKENRTATLPQPLQETIRLYEENPESSLKDIANAFEPPLSKSGLNHRIQKLISLANDTQKREIND